MGNRLFASGSRWPLQVVALGLLIGAANAAEEGNPSTAPDEEAIRAVVQSYVEAYNRGDAQAVANHWSDSGEWVSPSGQRFQGKEAIAKEMKALFAENPGVRIEVINASVRMVSPDVALEEGTVRVVSPTWAPSDATYLAIHVKKDGQWKMDSVRETATPPGPLPDSPLQDLAWLVGEWIDTSPEGAGSATVAWTKNRTFLNYSFRVAISETDPLEGTQVVGWDPVAGTVRSWMFDSDGGFGEGTWTKKDNCWVVKFHQVLPDGRSASATNIYTRIDGNTFTWKSVGRNLDGEFLPNTDDVTMVRKTAATAPPEKAKPAETPKKRGGKK